MRNSLKHSSILIPMYVAFFTAGFKTALSFFVRTYELSKQKTYFVFLSSLVKPQSVVDIIKTSSSSMRRLNCVY